MKAAPEARLATAFENARALQGWSYNTVGRKTAGILGDGAPTDPAIVAYHKGTVRTRLNIEVVLALCALYKLDLGAIAPELMPRVTTLVALLGPNGDGGQASGPDQQSVVLTTTLEQHFAKA
jgi:hypothetical protein